MERFKTLRDGRESAPAFPQQGFIADTSETITPGQNARSFLMPPGQNDNPRAPADARTGVPLPLAPVYDLSNMKPQAIQEHHLWYPRLSPQLRTLGGMALRVSLIQKVHMQYHNQGKEKAFHHIFGPGVKVPEDIREQVGLCVVQAAGYLPDMVVDTSHGEPLVRAMKTWERNRLQKPDQFVSPSYRQVVSYRNKWLPEAKLCHAKSVLIDNLKSQSELSYRDLHYGYDALKKLFTDYVTDILQQNKNRDLKRFTSTKCYASGLRAIEDAVSIAARQATVGGLPLNLVYKNLQSEGMLHPKMLGSAEAMLLYKIGNESGRRLMLDGLYDQMQSA